MVNMRGKSGGDAAVTTRMIVMTVMMVCSFISPQPMLMGVYASPITRMMVADTKEQQRRNLLPNGLGVTPPMGGISFNVQPKMKALEIAEKARDAILSKKFEQVRVNLPNGDMVRHTGDMEATIVACKAADQAVKIPIAIGGHRLAPSFWFRKDLPSGGLANVAATMINLHGFEAPSKRT